MNLSKALRRFRNEFGQTQKEVAEHANVDVRTYQNYEYGEIVSHRADRDSRVL